MGTIYVSAYFLLVVTMCGVDEACTSTATDSGRLAKLQTEKGRFTRTPCQWDQSDKSVMCYSKHLSTVPSDFPPYTLELYLQNNDISILLNTSFEPYPNLVSLDLTRNELRRIQSAAFQPLKYLESLILCENTNLVIPSSVPFQPLEALMSLDISKCDLNDLPNDLLDNFPNLRFLVLSHNLLSSLNVSRCTSEQLESVELIDNKFRDLTPDTFKFVCPTKEFFLLMNPIRYISENAIAALPVEQLSLGVEFAPNASMFLNITRGVAMSRNIHNKLGFVRLELHDGLPNGVFRPLYDHPLQMLFIALSGELYLSKDVFFGLSCITLLLKDNIIFEIEPEYFLGMSRLQNLVLEDNQVMLFNRHNTTWQSNVQYLDLSGNKLLVLSGYQFRGLRNLHTLNLSRNMELGILDLFSYDGCERLGILDVTRTAIVHLGLPTGLSEFFFADLIRISVFPLKPGQTFNYTIKLRIIDVSHTELNEGHLWDSYFSRSLFQGLIHMWELHLSNNPLKTLPDRVFEDNVFLVTLFIDNCKISSLAGSVFQGLHSLNYLDLNGNNLLLISTNALKNLPVLESLSINDNTIMCIEEGAMENVPLLKNLRMANNRLIAFNRSTWNTLMNYELDYIDISGNPLDCQCNYNWLHNLVNSSAMFVDQNKTLCSVDSLSQLRGKPLLEFDPSKYCIPNILLMSTLPFVALAFLIGLLLAFHNRWLIRYKLFLMKLAVIGYIEIQDARGHKEFIYDFNIMFTEEDEGWAREHLRPTLEERLPDYDRYSFGDEDLTLGMHYLQAVHYAVENSFKTILLLSRRAVRDNWFLIKLRTAMDHVHDERTENTVVIFLEDIPEDEIPYLLRLYLSDRSPYMRWPEDVRGQEYFWKELTKVATVNLRYNPLVPPE